MNRLKIRTKKAAVPLSQLLPTNQLVLVDFRVSYTYENGERTDKPNGVSYTIADMLTFNRFDVFVPVTTPVVTEEKLKEAESSENRIFVTLTNAIAKPIQAGYGEIEFSVSADSIEIVS